MKPTCTTYKNGDKAWHLNGKFHRTDGPALECANGDKEWFLNGILHRTDGPAIEFTNGDKIWYVNGIRHRIDGPAVEYSNGDKSWYLNNKKFETKQAWIKAMLKQNLITQEEAFMLAL